MKNLDDRICAILIAVCIVVLTMDIVGVGPFVR